MTDVDYVVVREGKNLKGQVLRLVLRSGGKRSLTTALGTTVKAIEAQQRGTYAPTALTSDSAQGSRVRDGHASR